ncbi:MAG TPA: agmatinase [Candidatus Acidoferrales bacterium]|jgi:arginase|nr:agmatinase [Candidatus Acidoferrales bacterium]
MTVALLGLPTDRNSSYLRGPAKAPAAIRRELFSESGNSYTETGLNLRGEGVLEDAGDAALHEDDGDVERITEAVAAQLGAGRRVVSLGGDHFVTFPILKAYAAAFPNISIVHFDAHPDMYPSFHGNPLSHASPFARILENGGIAALVQIGIRTMTPAQQRVAGEYGVRVFGAWELDAARAALPQGPVYVTLDLDGLDPAFAPGVSHREPGGLSVREVLELVRAIPGTVVGADVVEYNPDCDVAGMTATVAAKFAREFAARIYTDAQGRGA